MAHSLALAPAQAVAASQTGRRRISAGFVVLAIAPFLVYLALGVALAFGYHVIIGDAWSRVANAHHVLFSRDPHLAAIGFVWTPLPSLLAVPFFALKPILPGVITEGFAANIVSAIGMAGAAWQLRQTLALLDVRPLTAWVLTLLFALHPMVIAYGANGMSEAIFLFTVLLTVRHLVRWTQDRSTGALIMCGLGLALAYLTRYEAVVVAAGAAAVVGFTVLLGRTGRWSERLLASVADVLVLLMPIWGTMAVWAAASWMITGQPFEILTSVYGNSAYVERAATENAAATGQGTAAAVDFVIGQLVGLQPFAVVVAGAALILALSRRDWRVFAILVPIGLALTFQVFAFLNGNTYGWLRFYITLVPFTILLAGVLLARPRTDPAAGERGGRRRRAIVSWGLGIATVLLLVAAVPTSVATMADPALGRGETAEIAGVLMQRTGEGSYEQFSAGGYRAGRQIAASVDAMDLAEGTVLVDAATAFPILMQAEDPRVYVITTDRDFSEVLADPAAAGIRYVLLPPDFRGHDAINRAYPDLYTDGASWAELVREFDAEGHTPDWRMYRVTASSTSDSSP